MPPQAAALVGAPLGRDAFSSCHEKHRAQGALLQEHRSGNRFAAHGFTLVELLVVITILGLLGATVLMTAPLGQDPLLRESERLGAHLVRAQEEAILGTREVEVAIDMNGYGFSVRRLGGWQPLDAAPFDAVAWADGVAPVLPRDTGRTTVRFDPIGAATPATVTLARGARAVRIEVDGAGVVRIEGDGG